MISSQNDFILPPDKVDNSSFNLPEDKSEQKLSKKKLRDKDDNEPNNGMEYFLETLPSGKKQYRYTPISNEGLSQLNDYQEAYNVPDFIFVGRHKNTKLYKDYKKYPQDRFHILHPEARGVEWNLARNGAFMLGAMQSGKSVKLLSSINEIHMRGQDALDGIVYEENEKKVVETKLGYALTEVLWLLDNGYTFKYDETKHYVIATPPNGLPVENPVIRTYGHTFDPDAKDQVARLKQLSDQLFQEGKNARLNKPLETWGNTNERPWNKPASTLTTNKKEEIGKKLENKTQFLSSPKSSPKPSALPLDRPWRKVSDSQEKFSTNFFSEKNNPNEKKVVVNNNTKKKVVVNNEKKVNVASRNKFSKNNE